MRAKSITIDVRGTKEDIEQVEVIIKLIENSLRVGIPLKATIQLIAASYDKPE